MQHSSVLSSQQLKFYDYDADRGVGLLKRVGDGIREEREGRAVRES